MDIEPRSNKCDATQSALKPVAKQRRGLMWEIMSA
jgi:hypothetical protein